MSRSRLQACFGAVVAGHIHVHQRQPFHRTPVDPGTGNVGQGRGQHKLRLVLFQPPAQFADVLVAAGHRTGHDDRLRPAAANRSDDVIGGGEDRHPAAVDVQRRPPPPTGHRHAEDFVDGAGVAGDSLEHVPHILGLANHNRLDEELPLGLPRVVPAAGNPTAARQENETQRERHEVERRRRLDAERHQQDGEQPEDCTAGGCHPLVFAAPGPQDLRVPGAVEAQGCNPHHTKDSRDEGPVDVCERSREGLAALEGDEESSHDRDDHQKGVRAAQKAAQEPHPFPSGEPRPGGLRSGGYAGRPAGSGRRGARGGG